MIPTYCLFVPKLSPHTTTVANGSIRVAGELADIDRLLVDATVDRLDVTLFDYAIRNARPIRLALDQHVVRVQDLQLVGEDTQLSVGGTISLHDERIALRAWATPILEFCRASSRKCVAPVARNWPPQSTARSHAGVFSATISGGRLRHFSLPNALDAINGTVRDDARAVRLDDVTAGRVVAASSSADASASTAICRES